jgi:predicted alpha/beta superfamily hydrolase
MRFLIRCVLTACTCLGVCAAQVAVATPAAPPPYTLDHTEVIAIPAARLERAYEIYVSLPADYAKTARRYPVVYVTDAPYAFPLVRAIAGRVNRHGAGLEDFILVGLGYAQGDSGIVSRNRDYTPTERRRDLDKPEGVYGQGGSYLEFLGQDVLPLVDARYRTDPRRRVYVGHSYGSLLGLQALLERPGLFSHHILGSPSLWFDQGQPFDALQRYARTHTGLAAQVRFYVGGLERPSRTHPDDQDMVAQLQRYMAALRAQRWRALDVQASVLDGEDHATVFPRLVTQGLLWALPKPR